MTGRGDVAGVEFLDLGARPRLPWSSRTRRGVGAAVVAAAVTAVGLAVATGPDDAPAPVAVAAPRSSGFAAGPVLVPGVDGHDQLTVPGAALAGGAAMNVAIEPDDDLVAAVRATIPSLDHVRGGRVSDPEVHYGFFLQGAYTAAGGVPVQLTLLSARAAGTPQSRKVAVDRALADGVTQVRTDASFYTGTGWWVHGVATAPDGSDASAGQADLLQRLVADSRLVA